MSEDSDGEIVDMIVPSPRRAVAAPYDPNWTPRMVISINDAVAMVDERQEFMTRVMRKDLDYGVIPGTRGKPTLLKPGAERLLSAFGLHPELADEVPPTLDITGEDHGGEPFIQFRRTCRIWRQTGPGADDRMLVAAASGECNSWESKYRYRQSDRVCPECGKATIKKSRGEDFRTHQPRTGWYCFEKIGGCGKNWSRDDEPAIVGQQTGRTANPDIADVFNTLLKLADKRALVAATIMATGWSDIVTQDLEDHVHEVVPEATQAEAPAAPRASTAGPAPGSAEERLFGAPSGSPHPVDVTTASPASAPTRVSAYAALMGMDAKVRAPLLTAFGYRSNMAVDAWLAKLDADVLARLVASVPTGGAVAPQTEARPQGRAPVRSAVLDERTEQPRACPVCTVGNVERLTWPDGNVTLGCTNWREKDGDCRFKGDDEGSLRDVVEAELGGYGG